MSVKFLRMIFVALLCFFLLNHYYYVEADAPPEISSLSQTADGLAGGAQVTIKGKNFSPDSRLILGDSPVKEFQIKNRKQISFRVPEQRVPGVRTLTVITPAGIAQHSFSIISKPLSELAGVEITTVAGGIKYLGDGEKVSGEKISLSGSDLVADGEGNIFVADSLNNRVRRIDTRTGIIYSVAGDGMPGFSGDGGPALCADLSPKSLALDRAGNLFIVDISNRVRRVDAVTGIITTVAGNGQRSPEGDGRPATEIGFFEIKSIAIDQGGNLFISDPVRARIRRVDAQTGIITTAAGIGIGGFSIDGTPATRAKLQPGDITFDSSGNLIFVDEFRIRKIDRTKGLISTIAGNGGSEFTGDDGPALEAGFLPIEIALDKNGDLFIADSNRVRRLDSRTGIVTTVAGNGKPGSSGDGGVATSASSSPVSLTIDGSGNLIILESSRSQIRKIDRTGGLISTIASDSKDGSGGDGGPATVATLGKPSGLAFDREGNLFIADRDRQCIRRVDRATGIITTVAGSGVVGFSGDGGPAKDARLAFPSGVALDQSGNLFIADTFNNRIRRVDIVTGKITTVAGSGQVGFGGDFGPATDARITLPANIAVDGTGNLFIADTRNNRIREVDARTGIITTIAGDGFGRFTGDGDIATSASLFSPGGIAIDKSGNLFIADTANNRVRRVDANSKIIDTVVNDTDLPTPKNIAIDDAGDLFISDATRKIVIRVDSLTGIIITIAGNDNAGYSGDGGIAFNASLQTPAALAIFDGDLFLADSDNNVVRAVKGVAKRPETDQNLLNITGAIYTKQILTITGRGFGPADAKVRINDQDVSNFIIGQSNAEINLRGKPSQLNLKTGANEIVVLANGMRSNTFTLK